MKIAKHRDAKMLVDAQQRIHNDLGVAWIERGDRLVGENDVGLLHQRAGDGDALLLAAGELIDPLRGERRDIELLERRERDRLVLGRPRLQQRPPGRHLVEPAHQDVGQHVEPANQVELLEDHGGTRPPFLHVAAAQRGDVDAVEQDPAFAGLGQTVDHAQQGRLAGAGSADDTNEAAGRDRERRLVDRSLVAEPTRQLIDNKHVSAFLVHLD